LGYVKTTELKKSFFFNLLFLFTKFLIKGEGKKNPLGHKIGIHVLFKEQNAKNTKMFKN